MRGRASPRVCWPMYVRQLWRVPAGTQDTRRGREDQIWRWPNRCPTSTANTGLALSNSVGELVSVHVIQPSYDADNVRVVLLSRFYRQDRSHLPEPARAPPSILRLIETMLLVRIFSPKTCTVWEEKFLDKYHRCVLPPSIWWRHVKNLPQNWSWIWWWIFFCTHSTYHEGKTFPSHLI